MEHGNVTTVTYKDGIVYCSVRPVRYKNEYQKVPVLKPHSGFIQVPEQGDTVALDSLADGTRFITAVVSKEDSSPDDMNEGELAIQLDGGTRVQFEENKKGNYDLHIDASGDVFIDGINFDSHTHPYTDDEISDTSDGSGSETVQNKTTDVPNKP